MNGSSKAQGDVILAIDVGTQSIRAGLVDLTGEIHDLVKTPIEPYFSDHPGWAEQQPDYYWQMLCQTCQKVFEITKHPKEAVIAVSLASQRATYVNVDKDGNPLRPAIIWLDQRKADTTKILPGIARPILKAARLHEFIEFAVQYCRSNWIQQNQPDIWEKTHKFLYLPGYLTFRLTGEFRDSTGNVIGTIPFNVKKFDWAGRFDPKWKIFPLEKDKLAELVPPTEVLGQITAQAAEETGIPKDTPMISASNDKACEVIGAGCLTPERACISFGTIATINTQIQKYVEVRPFMPPFPSAVPGQFYTEVSVMRGFWMVSWFKQEFGLQERLQALETQAEPEELLENLIKDVPPGSMGLVLQPYWTPGPEMASYTKGSIIGFGDIHTRAHLYRSIAEGLAFALKEGAQLTEKKNKIPITHIRASGGGSRSDSIMQLTADIFGLPVHRPHTNETSTLGAAMDAAVGLKLFSDFHQAVKAMTRVSNIFDPIPENNEIYQDLYQRVYLKIYKKLLPLFKEIRDITNYPE